MSRETAATEIDSLSPEEADLLNNSPDLLQAFQAKHGIGQMKNSNEEQGNGQGIISQIGSIANQYDKSQFGSPQQLLGTVQPLAHEAAAKVGDFVQRNISQGPSAVDPTTAKIVGGVISYAPDIASLAMPVENSPEAAESAVGPMRRALGYTKRFLGTPEARESADEAARVALEQGVMPRSGSPEGAARNLEALQGKTGQALGDIRGSVGNQPIDSVFNSLEQLRQNMTNGATGGIWDTVHNRINSAQETLLGLLKKGPDVSLNDVTKAKKMISDSVNWLADNNSQTVNKKIVGSIESGVEDILNQKGADLKKYKSLKRIYGGASNALEALQNEISKQEGNNALSLQSMGLGAGALASGHPMAAIGAIGGFEGWMRHGAGISANLLNAISNNPAAAAYLTSLGLSKLK